MTTCLTLNPYRGDVMAEWCQSWATQDGKIHTPVEWDNQTRDKSQGENASAPIQLGADMLDTAIGAATGSVIVFGHGDGAQVASRWLLKYADTSGYSDLKFILTGNPASAATPNGHAPWMSHPTPTSTVGGYPIIDIGRASDGYCRWVPTEQGSMTSGFFNNLSGMLRDHILYDIALESDGAPTSYLSTATVGDAVFYTVD